VSGFANRAVEILLQSPAHPILSGKVQLIRYEGRRTGRVHTTPTQFVELGPDRVAIVVGRPQAKQWWRNFREPRSLQLRIRGVWRDSRARAAWRHEETELVDAALTAFTAKYGSARNPISDADGDPLVVVCDLVPEGDA
jgi:hypothetical protein